MLTQWIRSVCADWVAEFFVSTEIGAPPKSSWTSITWSVEIWRQLLNKNCCWINVWTRMQRAFQFCVFPSFVYISTSCLWTLNISLQTPQHKHYTFSHFRRTFGSSFVFSWQNGVKCRRTRIRSGHVNCWIDFAYAAVNQTHPLDTNMFVRFWLKQDSLVSVLWDFFFE